MNEQLLDRKLNNYEKLTITEMLDKAGSSNKYQLRMFIVFFFNFFFAAFIQMGFPIIFQHAKF